MILSLLLQQCPVFFVRLTWMVLEMGGKWPYSCFVSFCFLFFLHIMDWLNLLVTGCVTFELRSLLLNRWKNNVSQLSLIYRR